MSSSTVLVVANSPLARRQVASELVLASYVVFAAGSRREALNLITAGLVPAAVVVDGRDSVDSALSFAAEAAARTGDRHPTVIVVDDVAPRRPLQDARGVAYLAVPIAQLKEALDKVTGAP